MSHSRWGLVVAGAVVFALVASQILIPSFGERRVEDRLTEGGGSADVTLGAFPAARLLFADGERFEVEARELDLALDRREEVFERLDGFALVDVSIADSVAGPFRVSSFDLHREGDGPYTLRADAVTSPSLLVDYGIEGFEVPGDDLASIALDLLGIEYDVDVPIELDMELTSDAGRIHVVDGGGSVAGLPTGPLAELLTAAFVVQL